ncbi:MAG: hypothetical protein HUK40_17350 [Desulfobacter sp.]|nr:hypothetical protein [Desulfobacter sp.]
MAWDPERYREKREKVLGIQKRGVSFGSLTAIISMVILLGMASLSVPGAVSYIQTRHLDDAIYRLKENTAWPKPLVAEVQQLKGVRQIFLDTHDTRLVVTFDRRHTSVPVFSTFFKKKNLKAALLNQVSHRQRMNTLKQEKEAEGETP